jgi:diguanylate cyclase (GGDEF)-like protein
LLAEERRAAAHWGTYSVMAGVSMWLLSLPQTNTGPGWMSATLIASLVGYAGAVRGVDLFLHGRARFDRFTLSVAALACGSLLCFSESIGLTRASAAVFCLARLLLLTGSPLLFAREIHRQFGAFGAVITVVPSLLFGLTAVPVLFQLAVMPDVQDRLQAAQRMSLSQLAFALVTAALFNFSFLYLLVGRLFKRLRHQAQYDALTGLLNRRAMDLALEQQWHMQRRHGHGLTLAVLDIDHFKRINDTYGHAIGDQALVMLARTLANRVRSHDIVARMGGEEFLLVMPSTDADGGHQVVERLREVVETLRLATPDGREVRFTMSAGLACVEPEDRDLAEVMNRADAGVYRAKHAGRNRVVVERPALSAI